MNKSNLHNVEVMNKQSGKTHKVAAQSLKQSLSVSPESVPLLVAANSLPFRCDDTKPDFRTIRTLNKLWARTYLHGSFYFEDRDNRIPPMNFQFQKNDNLELLFRFGKVQFIRVLMSVQYYAKQNLAVIVLRIHPDTHNQFKELIHDLREAYEKVDGEWIARKVIQPAEHIARLAELDEIAVNRMMEEKVDESETTGTAKEA